FDKVAMAGKKPGDAGFGGNDLPKLGGAASTPIQPEAVVANADFELPYSDDDLLARKYTVAQALALYRAAYTPKEGAPVINAGDPASPADPLVTDGKVDIGAIER